MPGRRSTTSAHLRIPSPLARFYSHFPLLTLPSPHLTTPAPSLPTIWAYGPPPSGHTESLDPACRAAQAYARFAGQKCEVRWIGWEGREGAPGGQVPALHTSEGDLFGGEELEAWLAEKAGGKDTTNDATHQAYLSLLTTTLLPAVLAALYLSPSTLAPSVVPIPSRPFLSSLAQIYLTWNDRSSRIDEIKRLRGGKVGKETALDLEEIEREAVEAIEAVEGKLKEQQGEGEWFGGASTPSRLDALLYALLSIVRILPPKCDSTLRPALERCPNLLAWVKKHDP
ncbi:hypothetical protein NBRC10513v2_002090 [Rhodotorula toruloides]|uniref:Metaxin glutathione S-transferase domain-containing protein n=1 Tax=Rhodotorula toruloides TaxID=5286 RepID=A0A2S9ZW47_RHOTO|nr:hypothetical protein AAT19DRAFT_11630 [Rhodotorula toruloides]